MRDRAAAPLERRASDRRVTARAGAVALACGAIAVLVASAGTAHGDAALEARFFDERARAEFAQRRYADALISFLRVQRVAPSAATLFNIGVCAEHTGDRALAYTHFEEFTRQDGITAEQRTDAERRMRALEPALARVTVESDPPGATIWVDRRELGAFGTTPRTIVLEPGAHEIELEREGRRTARGSVEARRGAVASLRLELAAEEATLAIEAPAGARVHASGATEIDLAIGAQSIPTGRWRVRAELDGHAADEREIVVRAGASETLRLAPTPLPGRVGRMLASTGSVRATLSIDGVERGETPARIDGVAEGEHEVVLAADGWVSWTGRVRVEAGRSSFVDVTLVPRR
jgi:hypothetical protein